MAKIKKTSNVAVNATSGVAKFSYYVLIGLVASTIFCIIYGCFGGKLPHYKYTQDNAVTGSLQNYYFIIGALALIPGIVFMSKGLKEEFNKRFWGDEKRFGICSVFVFGVIVITAFVCSWAHDISATTTYGINGYMGAVFFLVSAIPFIMTSLFYGVLKTLSMLKLEGEFTKSIKKYLPIIFLVIFMILTFVSCMLAPGAADDVIGSEKATEMGATPSEVLSKTFNGCTNLKDGYWAFMMYGSIFVVSILLGKESKGKKLMLIKIFVGVFTLISLLTLCSTVNSVVLFRSVFPERGIYRNANHFAYILCMSVVASMILAVNERKWYFKLLYLVAYWFMLEMLIMNNTFGGYLGVLTAILGFTIYGATILYSKLFGNGKKLGLKIDWSAVITFALAVAIFLTGTFLVTDKSGAVIAINNIKSFAKDFELVGRICYIKWNFR